MYKIGVLLGDRDSVYGFGALGLEVFPVEEPEAGAKLLRRLAEEGYAVLYVTEALCAQIPDESRAAAGTSPAGGGADSGNLWQHRNGTPAGETLGGTGGWL